MPVQSGETALDVTKTQSMKALIRNATVGNNCARVAATKKRAIGDIAAAKVLMILIFLFFYF